MEDLQKFTSNPRQSLAQRATGVVKDNWVIAGLIVAILSVALYAVVAEKTSLPYNPSGSSVDNRYMLNETSIFPDYGTIISSGLEKNFEKINREIFSPKIHEKTLNATKWRDLFESTQEMIKGMKLIKMQEEELNAKHKHFNSTQNYFDECKSRLLNQDLDMKDDTSKMQEANVTIAHAEGVLEGLRDELVQQQNRRREEINQTNVEINHRQYEKQLINKKISQSANKDQLLQDLQAILDAIQEKIRTKKLEIQALKAQQKSEMESNNNLETSISQLKDQISKLQFDIATLEVNMEIDQIIGRVKREEHINNTKQMISTVQKRIKIFNNHKLSTDDTIQLEQQLNHDKQQLKDLNALQINLIKSFYQKSISPSGKTLDQLRQEEKNQKSMLESLNDKYTNRDSSFNDYEKKIDAIEQELRLLQEEESKAKEALENAKMNSDGSSDKPVDAEQIRKRIKQLDDEIVTLKDKRTSQEVSFQNKIDETISKITTQKEVISDIYIKFTTYVKDRKNIEEKILGDLNRCRLHRYMMEVIQRGASEEHSNIAITQQNLKKIKSSIIELLNQMVPEEPTNVLPSGQEQATQQ